ILTLKYFLFCLAAYLFHPLKISEQNIVIRFSIDFPDMTIVVNAFEDMDINNHRSSSKQTYSMLGLSSRQLCFTS
ncbi:MAG: hypothetical protein WCA39_16325, partial [Nitrososphaeraceae archaeon]